MARDYTKIRAWQLANELALLVYRATKGFPKSEIWGLTSQMRRCAVELGYLAAQQYEELWLKAQECSKTLQGLISHIEKSDS